MASKKRSRGHRAPVKHVGALGGVMIFGLDMIFGNPQEGSGWSSPYSQIQAKGFTAEGLNNAKTALVMNLKQPTNYIPLVVGSAVSASPRIPILKMAAGPLNTAIKSFAGKKWGL